MATAAAQQHAEGTPANENATANEAAKKPKKAQPAQPRTINSRPVFKRKITLNSLPAQRVIERSYVRTAQSMFSIEVILRIIDRSDFVDDMQKLIANQMAQMTMALQAAHQAYDKKMLDAGVEDLPTYSNPKPYELEMTTPQGGQFIGLIDQLDKLIGKIDALWWASQLDGGTRTDENYNWQQMMFKLAGRIQSIEGRARKAADQQGKGDEVQSQAPALAPANEQTNDDAHKAMEAGAAELEAETVEAAA